MTIALKTCAPEPDSPIAKLFKYSYSTGTMPLFYKTSRSTNSVYLHKVQNGEPNGKTAMATVEVKRQDSRRWNYDFERDTPLDGIYKWEAAERKDVPNFYWRPPREQVSAADGSVDVNGNQALVYVGTLAGDTLTARPQQKDAVSETTEHFTDSKEQCCGVRKRAASMDAFPEAKRMNTQTEAEWSASSPSLSALEKTPKKSISSGHQT
ncbi:cyclin-dependent kinase inhibitor 1B-like [Scyliorhinus torazame]|uniref:cyclin-dependent kinase inhibitor 1B-like n=1 Tax=Scyliorhinus torazame TaxID=75743 RepID=UPI003B5AA6E5